MEDPKPWESKDPTPLESFEAPATLESEDPKPLDSKVPEPLESEDSVSVESEDSASCESEGCAGFESEDSVSVESEDPSAVLEKDLTAIVVLGMRCSGTNYVAELIKNNYPDIQVEQGACDLWKHLWQVEQTVDKAKMKELDEEPNLYVYVCRNVFDWLPSFNRQPHHCLWANGLTLEQLLAYTPFESRDEEGQLFESYPSILDARNTKQAYIIDEMEPVMKNFIVVNYEDVRDNPNLIKDILSPFGFRRQESIINVTYYKQEVDQLYVPKQYPKISPETMQFIVENVDWATEAKLGYDKPTLTE